jgi:hypothetical protein
MIAMRPHQNSLWRNTNLHAPASADGDGINLANFLLKSPILRASERLK